MLAKGKIFNLFSTFPNIITQRHSAKSAFVVAFSHYI